MARRGLLRTVQLPDDLSNRFQANVRDAIETLAADHDIVTAPVLSLQASGPIAPGTTFVAFRGPAGQTLTLPPASAPGTSQAVILWLQNTSAAPVTVAAPAASTVERGGKGVVPAGSFAAFVGDGVNKWLSGGITMIGNKTNNAAAPAADNVGALTAQANAAAQAWTEGRLVLLSVDLAGNLRTLTVGGKTNNNAAPGATNVGALVALANAAAPAWTEGNEVLASVDLVGNLRVRHPESTLMVTATAAANTGFTLTLPAAGAGLFHYITSIEITRAATAALAGTAVLTYTSTNLPGLPIWTFGNAMVAGGTQNDVNYRPTSPLKSSAANTATTIVVPAPGAAVIVRANVSYYTGP